jgi:hypothetical protein
MRFIDREEVARRLTYDVCIPIVRDAMIGFLCRRNQTGTVRIDASLFSLSPIALAVFAESVPVSVSHFR